MPAGHVAPLSSTIRTDKPVGVPTVCSRAYASAAGRTLLAWCVVSVMPYAASTGALNVASIRLAMAGESGALQLRMKRN